MSDQNLAPMMDDMELVSLYINEQLPADQMERVRERLRTDEEFRFLAEPMMFATAILRQQLTRPRPPGELEKHWDAFTRKAGFVHQKQRSKVRRLWMLGVFVTVVGLGALLLRERIQSAYRDWRDYTPVGADTGWILLRNHIQVRIEPGARLRAAKELRNNGQFLKMHAGVAHFRVQLSDTTRINPAMTPVIVETRAGHVFSGYGDFTVTVRGDTTDVQDHPPERPRYIGFMPFPSMTMVRIGTFDEPVRVTSSERIRLIRGQPLQRMP